MITIELDLDGLCIFVYELAVTYSMYSTYAYFHHCDMHELLKRLYLFIGIPMACQGCHVDAMCAELKGNVAPALAIGNSIRVQKS